MTTKTALFALLAVWGVGASCGLPAFAEEDLVASASEELSPMKRSFTNRAWVREGDEGDLPGVIRIFLSDGTLVQDSCWETHRLSQWQMTSPTSLSWNEDGMDIAAEIVSVTSANLVLGLQLTGGTVVERYRAADVPSVCPDIPKS